MSVPSMKRTYTHVVLDEREIDYAAELSTTDDS